MKYLKMLGLAAIAALGLMAFVGAGTASATTLCTTNESPCPTMDYGAGQTYHVTLKAGSTAKLTSGSSTIATCNISTATLEQTGTSATWLTLHVKRLVWEGCTTTTDTVTLGKLTIMWTSGTSATVEGDETEVTLELFGVSCTYGAGAGTHLGTMTGGSSPVLNISTTVTKTAGGFLCPSTAGWDAEYELTEPHAVFAVE